MQNKANQGRNVVSPVLNRVAKLEVFVLNRVGVCGPYTVHSPLFSCKIIKIERYAIQAAILDECQNYLATCIIPDACPLGTFENQDGLN